MSFNILIIHILGNIFSLRKGLHKLCVLQCLGYGILEIPPLQDIAGACIIFSNLVCIIFFIVELMNQNQIIRGMCNVVFTLDGSPSTHF